MNPSFNAFSTPIIKYYLSVEEMQEMMNITDGSFERNGMRVNVDETKVMIQES